MDNKPQRYSQKLKRYTYDQFAAGETLEEVQTLILRKFMVEVPINTLNTWRHRKRDFVKQRRLELNDQIREDIPVANLFYRLQMRQKMIDAIRAKGLFYEDQNGVEKSRCLEINKMLDSVADELKPIININIDSEINTIINATDKEFQEFLIKER